MVNFVALPDTGAKKSVAAELDLKVAINTLRREKNAVILAHYYQDYEIQDIADYVGDSLDPVSYTHLTLPTNREV